MVLAASLTPSACRSQAASGWVCRTIGVWAVDGMGKPLSGAISRTGRFWAEVETARLHKEMAVRVSLDKAVASRYIVFLRQRMAARLSCVWFAPIVMRGI